MGRHNPIQDSKAARKVADAAITGGKTLKQTAAAITKQTGVKVNKNTVAAYNKRMKPWLEAKRLNDELTDEMRKNGEIKDTGGAFELLSTATLNLFRQQGTKTFTADEAHKMARTILSLQQTSDLIVKSRERQAVAAALSKAAADARETMETAGTADELIAEIVGTIFGRDV